MLPKLSLERANVFDAMCKCGVLVVELLVDLGAEVVDVLALVPYLVSLLIQVVSQVVELLFGEGSGGLVRVAAGLLSSQPVADPGRSLFRAAAVVGAAVAGGRSRGLGVEKLSVGGLARRHGECVVVYDVRLGFEVVHAGCEGDQLSFESSLLCAVRACEGDGGLLGAMCGDLSTKGGVEAWIV